MKAAMTKSPPQRNTRQRTAVRTGLEQEPGFISAQDLHAQLRGRGDAVGLATVYRVLADMVRTGEADAIYTEEGMQLFRACEDVDGHHHHLICVDCGTAVEIDPPVEGWLEQVSSTHGFTPIRHVLDVFGRCADCQAKQD
ncbi:Fur family transcriptional regulator, ferric uptake regulator [Micrococcales bacterium KH10]|nr:Fur family transcriptional regulator, ferric uptake regulator [Micrococcales bacterium KH10]